MKSSKTFFKAAAHGDTHTLVQLLRSHGRGLLHDMDNKRGWSPLHVGAALGRHDVVKLLLKAGARANARATGSGDTPLHIAIQAGHFGVVRSLIKRGADVRVANAQGVSPMDLLKTLRNDKHDSSGGDENAERAGNAPPFTTTGYADDDEESFISSGSTTSDSDIDGGGGAGGGDDDDDGFSSLGQYFTSLTNSVPDMSIVGAATLNSSGSSDSLYTKSATAPATSVGGLRKMALTRRGSMGGRKQSIAPGGGRLRRDSSDDRTEVLVAGTQSSDGYVAPFPIVTPADDPPVSLRKLRERLKDKVSVYAKHASAPPIDEDAPFIVVRLKAPDDSSKKIRVNADITGEELENLCCARANLTGPEAELMELVVLDPVDECSIITYVYDPEPISAQGIGPGSILYLRVKHFKLPVEPSIPLMNVLKDQILANIMDGSMVVSERLAIKLAGFALTITNGPFAPNAFYKGFLSDPQVLKYFLPPGLIDRYPPALWEDRLLASYASVGDLDLPDALAAFLIAAQESPNYGATTFKARARGNGMYARLGVAQDGVYVDVDGEPAQFYELYRSRGSERHLPNIMGWSGSGTGTVTLTVRAGESGARSQSLEFEMVGGASLEVEFLDLLSGYYILLVYSDAVYDQPILVLDEGEWPLPREPLPLRLPCKLAGMRKPNIPHSDLDWFVEHYHHESASSGKDPIVTLFPALHAAMDTGMPWRELHITDPQVTAAQLRVLTLALRTLKQQDDSVFGMANHVDLQVISFRGSIVGNRKERLGSAAELLATVGPEFAVQELDMSQCCLASPEHFERLAAGMVFLAPLHTLILDDNIITGADTISELKKGLKADVQELKRVSFRRTSMDDEAIIGFGGRLYDDESTITALDVSHNRITDFGFEHGLMVNLRNGSALNSLDAGHNSVSSSSTAMLLDKLKDVHMYILRLADFHLKAKHMDAIVARLSAVGELDISHNSISKGLVPLAEALSTNATVRILIANKAKLEKNGLAALGSALATNRHIRELRLTDNSINSKTGLALVAAATTSVSLRILDLSSNSLGKKFALGLADAVPSPWLNLEQLFLANNSLGSHGVAALAPTLNPLFPALRILDLSDVSAEDSGIAALAQGLVGNTVLRDLSIPGNYVTEPAFYDFLRALEDNIGLRRINATRNAVFPRNAFEAKLAEYRMIVDIDVSYEEEATTASLVSHKLSSWTHRLGLL